MKANKQTNEVYTCPFCGKKHELAIDQKCCAFCGELLVKK